MPSISPVRLQKAPGKSVVLEKRSNLTSQLALAIGVLTLAVDDQHLSVTQLLASLEEAVGLAFRLLDRVAV
jgi:hypothetical protein